MKKKFLVYALVVGFPIAGATACGDDDHCHEEPCAPSPGGAGGTSGGTSGSGGTAGTSDAAAD